MIEEIVKHYGLYPQLDMVMEECGELICVCTDLLASSARAGCIDRKLIEDNKGNLIEGLAHVKNTILSVCYLLYIPTSRFKEDNNAPVTESVWGDVERQLLSLCSSCGFLIKCCNKVERADGVGYKTQITEEVALTNLTNAMRHVFMGIDRLCILLGISETQIDRVIADSDKSTYELMQQYVADQRIRRIHNYDQMIRRIRG